MGPSADKPSIPVAADKTVVIACSNSWFDTSSSTDIEAPILLLVALVMTVPVDLVVTEEEEEEEEEAEEDKLDVLGLIVVVVARTFS